MTHSSYVVLLIKFVKEKGYATSFLGGDLFCKPWLFFKDIEDKQRGDKLELAASKLTTEVYISAINKSYNFWLEDGDDRFTPVFCMYQVSKSNRPSSIMLQLKDEKLREFGNYGVVITNTGEFVSRLNRNLPGFSYGLIDYIDYDNLQEDNNPLRNPILKKDRKTFGHQREFRIYNSRYAITDQINFDVPTKEIIQPNGFGASLFSMGSLGDIAEVHTIDELFHGLEVSVQNPISKKGMPKILWWDGNKFQEI